MLNRQLKSGPAKGDYMAELCQELLMGVTKVHINHLLVKGTGSFAAHKAMNDFYDSLSGLADTVAEAYQGASEKLIDFPGDSSLPIMRTSMECLAYMRKLYSQVDQAQKTCPYSEIVNELDGIKTLIDSTKYKLLFLQ